MVNEGNTEIHEMMNQHIPQQQPTRATTTKKPPAWLLPLCQWGGIAIFLAGISIMFFAVPARVGAGFGIGLAGMLLSTASVMALGSYQQKKVATLLAMGMTLLLAKGVLKLAES